MPNVAVWTLALCTANWFIPKGEPTEKLFNPIY
jgi:hypothetical protein